MADFTATFEAGVDGATITTGAGEASATAWSTVSGTPTYDNDHVAHGALAAKLAANGDLLSWNTAANPTDHYGRFYFYATANPTGATRIVLNVSGSGVGAVATLSIQTDGKFVVSTYLGGTTQVSTGTIALNQLIRFEFRVVHSGTVGFIQAKYFADAESATPTETVITANGNTGTSCDSVAFSNTFYGSAIWLDSIVANATSYPGPDTRVHTATFEAGVATNVISTAGGEAAATAWDSVFGTGGTYDTTHVAHGALAAKFTTNMSLGWTPSAISDHYGRFYLYCTNFPTSNVRLINLPGGPNAYLNLNTAGKTILAADNNFKSITLTNAIALNQWVRVEYHLVHSATVGQGELKLFNSAESSTATETLTSTADWDLGTSCSAITWGWVAGGGGDAYWLDSIVANATSYPGPGSEPAQSQTFMPPARIGRVRGG